MSFSDDEGNPEARMSVATDEVEPKPNSPATGVPTVRGMARIGETLTVDTSSIEDVDGLFQTTFRATNSRRVTMARP